MSTALERIRAYNQAAREAPATDPSPTAESTVEAAADVPQPDQPDQTADGSRQPQIPPQLLAAMDRAARAANVSRDWIASQPTPGGIGILVFALLVLVWVMVPTNPQGKTRAQLLWAMLTGRTQVEGRRDMAKELQLQASQDKPGESGGGGSPWDDSGADSPNSGAGEDDDEMSSTTDGDSRIAVIDGDDESELVLVGDDGDDYDFDDDDDDYDYDDPDDLDEE